MYKQVFLVCFLFYELTFLEKDLLHHSISLGWQVPGTAVAAVSTSAAAAAAQAAEAAAGPLRQQCCWKQALKSTVSGNRVLLLLLGKGSRCSCSAVSAAVP
jgi:hypothetical protein